MTPDEQYIDKLILQIRKLASVCFGIMKEDVHIQISPSKVAGTWFALVSREHVLIMPNERGKAQNAEGKTMHQSIENLRDALIDVDHAKWQERYDERKIELEVSKTELLPEDDLYPNGDRR